MFAVHSVSDLAPILEFDPDPAAVIEPTLTQQRVEAPRVAVACFFPEVLRTWVGDGIPILELPANERLWEIDYRGHRLGLFYPGMGAPLACARLERVIAAGCGTIVACGVGGALRADLDVGHHIITVTSAVRDEGTSYHYLPPSFEVTVDPEIVSVLIAVARKPGDAYLAGRTWTTDAWFRETAGKVARRREQGCLTVEMEAAALIAVARFRGVRFGQYLYAGDDLAGETWDHRSFWESPRRDHLVELAAEAAFLIESDANGLS